MKPRQVARARAWALALEENLVLTIVVSFSPGALVKEINVMVSHFALLSRSSLSISLNYLV